jgi:predicted SAM-dependent methyltransferase
MIHRDDTVFPPWRLLGLAFVVMVLGSCAGSRLTATWSDPDFNDPDLLDEVLVVGMFRDETIRRLYEDSLADHLRELSIQVTPSYRLRFSEIEPSSEGLRQAVKEAGATSVLMTRYLRTNTKERYYPPTYFSTYPHYRTMYGYFPLAYSEVYQAGYTETVKTVVLESNLYSVQNENLVWSARSESINPVMTRSFVDELAQIIVDDLRTNNILSQ